MITKQDFEKLMHDIKRIARTLPFLKDLIDKSKRDRMVDLLQDELDRLVLDLEEIKNKNGGNNEKE